MRIRKAESKDLSAILGVYEIAREYMRQNGNPDQWGTEKPQKELLVEDIKKGELFVGENEAGDICFVFAFILGEDPTYSYIEDGNWLSDAPYGTIHRIASNGTVHGVVKMAVDYCRNTISNIRIDTHEKNKTMQHVVEKLGFLRCGIIYISDGTPRIAYQLL
ncbi:MAG: N-acetyltransferase [Clostridia bacterium]|nr:N-acetyltransferase [Clostridia bacterium]